LWKRIGETYPEAQQKPRGLPSRRPAPIGSPEPVEVKVEGAQERSRPSSVQSQPESPRPETHQKQEYRSRPPAPPRSESVAGAKTPATPAALDAKLTVLQGVGPRHAETLGKLGLHTLGDMLYYYPRRYDDYSQLKPIKDLFYGEQVTVIGTVQTVHTRPIRGGKASIVETVISDGTAGIRLSFFNQPWMANRHK